MSDPANGTVKLIVVAIVTAVISVGLTAVVGGMVVPIDNSSRISALETQVVNLQQQVGRMEIKLDLIVERTAMQQGRREADEVYLRRLEEWRNKVNGRTR